jgi:hypothetical protein
VGCRGYAARARQGALRPRPGAARPRGLPDRVRLRLPAASGAASRRVGCTPRLGAHGGCDGALRERGARAPHQKGGNDAPWNTR